MADSSTNLVDRLRIANEVLALLSSDELPAIKRFLETASCQFNEIEDSDAFWSNDSSDEDFKRRIEASNRIAYVSSAPGEYSHFHVFVEPGAREHLRHYDAHLKAFMTVCYAAIGLDMKALGELPAIDPSN